MSEQRVVITGAEVDGEGVAFSRSTRQSFTTRVISTFVTRLAMVAGGIGSSILVARWIGATGVGELSVVNVTVALFLQLGSVGLPSAIVFFVAKDRRRLAAIASNALLFALVVGAALVLLLSGLASLYPALFSYVPERLLLMGAASLPFLLITLLGMNLLLAIDRVAQFNLLDAAAPLLVLLNVFVALLLVQGGLYLLITLNTAAAVLISLATVTLVLRSLKLQSDQPLWRPDGTLFRSMATYGMKFYVSIICGMIMIRGDLLIVNHFRGKDEAGIYAVASQVAMLLLLLPAVIATLLFPRIASSDDKQGMFTMRVTRHASFIMLIICGATVPLAFALPLVYGSAFNDATIQLLILLPGVYLMSIQAVLGQHFSALGLPRQVPLFWALTAGLSVALNLLLVPRFGARAAALNSTISYAVIFALMAYYFRLRTGNRLSQTLLLRAEEFRELLKPTFWRTRSARALSE